MSKHLFFPFSVENIVLNPSFIDLETLRVSLKAYESNNFIAYLRTLFDSETVNDLIATYYIGTSKQWEGANVFWLLDCKHRIRSGKIMLYNPETGKRVKEPSSCITWIHTALKLNDFRFSRCLFGEHLINLPENRKKPIAIVESEKTAIIASAYLPNFIWLATGGKSNLNHNIIRPLVDREVHFFPDTNAFGEWLSRVNHINMVHSGTRSHFNINDLLQSSLSEEEIEKGLDIADFLVRKKPNKPTTDVAPPSLGNTVSIPETTNKADSCQILTECLDTANLTVTEPVFYPFEHPIYATIRPKHPQKFDENGLIPKQQKELRKKGLYATDLRYFDFETLLKAFGLKDALAHAEHQTKIYQYEKYVLYPTYLEFVNALTQQNA